LNCIEENDRETDSKCRIMLDVALPHDRTNRFALIDTEYFV